MTSGEKGGQLTTRRLRDLGRFLVYPLAPLFRWSLGRDGSEWTLEEVRAAARDRPRSAGDIAMANALRFQAWLGAGGIALAAYGMAALLRSAATGTAASTLGGFMNVLITLVMFMLGMGLVSGLRLSSAVHYRDDLNRRLGAGDYSGRPPRRPGLLVASHLPTNFDVLVALFFTLCIAPNIYV